MTSTDEGIQPATVTAAPVATPATWDIGWVVGHAYIDSYLEH